MKKILSKIAACLLAGAMFFTVAGCNNDDDDDDLTTSEMITYLANGGSVDGGTLDNDATVRASRVSISNIDLNGNILTVEGTGATLDNLTNGTIVIGAGVGNGDAIISGCNVRLIKILGGGANSIHFKKKSTVETVEVAKEGVSLKFEEQPEIAKVEVKADNVSLISTAPEGKTVELPKVEIAADVKTVNIEVDKIEAIEGGSDELKLVGSAEVEKKPDNVADPVTITKVEITARPTKVEYKVGESISLDGIKLKVTYSDKSTADITDANLITVTDFDSTKEGKCTVKVSYKKIEAGSFDVTVIKPSSSDEIKNLSDLDKKLKGATVSADKQTITLADGSTMSSLDLFSGDLGGEIFAAAENGTITKYQNLIKVLNKLDTDDDHHNGGNHDEDDDHDEDGGQFESISCDNIGQLNSILTGADFSTELGQIILASGKFGILDRKTMGLIAAAVDNGTISNYPNVLKIYNKMNEGGSSGGDSGNYPPYPEGGTTNPYGTLAENEAKLAGAVIGEGFGNVTLNGTTLSASDPIVLAISIECSMNGGVNKTLYPKCYAVGKAFNLMVDGVHY